MAGKQKVQAIRFSTTNRSTIKVSVNGKVSRTGQSTKRNRVKR